MMDQHFKILEFLIDSGNTNCKLFYNTNLSNLKFKDKDVVEYWKHFSYVNLAVSLDDIGRRLEYQRKNIKWEKVKENFIRIKNETSNVQLMISPTVNLFNSLSITELHRTLVEDDLVRAEDVVPTLLVYPKEFNIQILTPQLKQIAKNRIEYHLDWLFTQQSSNAKKMDDVLRLVARPGDVLLARLQRRLGDSTAAQVTLSEHRRVLELIGVREREPALLEPPQLHPRLGGVEGAREQLQQLAPALGRAAGVAHVVL